MAEEVKSELTKSEKYEKCYQELGQALKEKGEDATEQFKQKTLCQIVANYFKDFNFVGFYDLKPEDPDTIYIGEWVSEMVFPCGEIKMGKGQCGQCAAERKTQIAYNVKELENYIACDDDTQSEIVVPCFVGEEQTLRTVLDIDSPNIGTFNEEDQKGLEKLVTLIYH